jgi:DNA topoisomerase-2
MLNITMKNTKKTYVKLDPIEHILKRPDMYVGSTKLKKTEEFILIDGKIVKQEVDISSAIIRIFIEALSNAVDNIERSNKNKTPCTTIKVSINEQTGETSIWNNGSVVPIEYDDDNDCYNHSLIFGQLLTGSNYDDDEERLVAGRNGLGIKLVSVFSTYFNVVGCDPENKKIFTQTWRNNMRSAEDPIIKKSSLKNRYTHVTWIPDFKQFGMKSYTKDVINMYKRFVYDASMIANISSKKKIDVYLNNEIINVKTLTDYEQLFDSDSEKILLKSNDSTVLLTTSNIREFQHISFVNGICTKYGGRHVDVWSEAIFRPIIDKLNGKDKGDKSKGSKLNINDVKQFFRIFVVSTVDKPTFDGQEKNKLESPDVSVNVPQTSINKILKWSVIEQINDIIRMKEMSTLKKVEKSRSVNISKYNPANKSNTKYSSKCSLLLVEGDSAKAFAVAGISKGSIFDTSGSDWLGVFPLTGKIMNTRNFCVKKIADNKVIVSLIQIIGLKYGVDYTKDENFKTLNYGRVVVLTDADCDGIHIEGLLINFIYSLFPTLLARKDKFLFSMKTPIVRVIYPKNVEDKLFYDENVYREWYKKQVFKKKPNIQYYKGLGTWESKDIPGIFGKKIVEFNADKNHKYNLDKAFDKNMADDRKLWIADYDPCQKRKVKIDSDRNMFNMDISDFINTELIKFSITDCERSIPNCIDGLKISQRKILFGVKKRKISDVVKVAQLGGYVAEHTNYHYGEQNLHETIIGMASKFVGNNNIPILEQKGQFGTRDLGGADSASPRYIFVKGELLKSIYNQKDNDVLNYIMDEGDSIEPYYYVPVIPMILVNGGDGIGTGWSCNIPCFNPYDVIKLVREWLDLDGKIYYDDLLDIGLLDNMNNTDIENPLKITKLSEIIPWYHEFKGDIVKDDNNSRYVTYGIINRVKNNVYHVSELPIGLWTNKFKDNLSAMKADKKIKDFTHNVDSKKVDFTITAISDEELTLKNMKLYTYLSMSNMVLFNAERKLVRYKHVYDVIDDFCKVRYEFYKKRKNFMLNKLERELLILINKKRFITEITNKSLILMGKGESEVIEEMTSRKYDEYPKVEETDDNKGYSYLLNMQIRTFTTDKIKLLDNSINNTSNDIKILKQTTEKQMWQNELVEVENDIKSYYKKQRNE